MVEGDRTELLVRQAKAGDRPAFGELFERHRDRLLARIRARIGKKLRQEVDPEDVLQETFLRAFETVGRFAWRGGDSFFSWLAAIAEHLILNSSQKRRPEPLKLDLDLPGSGVSPSRGLRREERLERLREALGVLSEEQRTAVLLARIEGLPFKEIALRMARSEEAVRQLLSRALKRLKRSLGDTESFHLPEGGLEEGDRDA